MLGNAFFQCIEKTVYGQYNLQPDHIISSKECQSSKQISFSIGYNFTNLLAFFFLLNLSLLSDLDEQLA
jgi:hypothetical protein